MSIRPAKSARAMTLVEVMISTVILGVAAMGALSFEYHAAGHARIARAQICGTRVARLLLEDWMSTGGAIDYDPTALDVGFSEDGDFYAITIDGYLKYYYFDERVLEGVLPGDIWLRGKFIPAPAGWSDYRAGI